jgi:4-aminobutyrate aminotransferase-like enzyme
MTESGPVPLMVNGFDGSGVAGLSPSTRDLLARREAALGGAYRLFYAEPVEFVRGSGVYLYDPDGRAYLDAYNNVPSVGHSHPRVTEAVSRQLATLNTHTRYLTDGVVGYAERLLGTHSIGPAQAMFTCTGSEANDLALRIARFHTGGTGVIVTANAYHGVTAAVAELSPSLGANVPLGAHVRAVPAPAAGSGSDFAAGVAAAIADLRRHGVRLAAFLADSIFSSDGVLPDPAAGSLARVASLVREEGGLYIADEVQSGFGRTGSHMWGYQRHPGLAPDIVTMGKPMGNGLPIAGLVAGQSVLADFGARARYFNTFGGNPVCVAAASAVLDVLADEELPGNAVVNGGYLASALTDLAAGSPVLADVRGAGLYLGVDVVSPSTGAPSAELAAAIVNGMRARRVLISATGPRGHVLKIRPPLPFGRAHADQLVAALAEVAEGVAAAGLAGAGLAGAGLAVARLAVAGLAVVSGEPGELGVPGGVAARGWPAAREQRADDAERGGGGRVAVGREHGDEPEGVVADVENVLGVGRPGGRGHAGARADDGVGVAAGARPHPELPGPVPRVECLLGGRTGRRLRRAVHECEDRFPPSPGRRGRVEVHRGRRCVHRGPALAGDGASDDRLGAPHVPVATGHQCCSALPGHRE